MKIIKEGHFEDKMHVKCPNCEAELEISSEDIKKVRTERTVWGRLLYTCAYCESENYLDDDVKLTIGVRRACYQKPFET